MKMPVWLMDFGKGLSKEASTDKIASTIKDYLTIGNKKMADVDFYGLLSHTKDRLNSDASIDEIRNTVDEWFKSKRVAEMGKKEAPKSVKMASAPSDYRGSHISIPANNTQPRYSARFASALNNEKLAEDSNFQYILTLVEDSNGVVIKHDRYAQLKSYLKAKGYDEKSDIHKVAKVVTEWVHENVIETPSMEDMAPSVRGAKRRSKVMPEMSQMITGGIKTQIEQKAFTEQIKNEVGKGYDSWAEQQNKQGKYPAEHNTDKAEQSRTKDVIDSGKGLPWKKEAQLEHEHGHAKECECCGEELNELEIKEGQGKCFPCIKGNCDICGHGDESDQNAQVGPKHILTPKDIEVGKQAPAEDVSVESFEDVPVLDAPPDVAKIAKYKEQFDALVAEFNEKKKKALGKIEKELDFKKKKLKFEEKEQESLDEVAKRIFSQIETKSKGVIYKYKDALLYFYNKMTQPIKYTDKQKIELILQKLEEVNPKIYDAVQKMIAQLDELKPPAEHVGPKLRIKKSQELGGGATAWFRGIVDGAKSILFSLMGIEDEVNEFALAVEEIEPGVQLEGEVYASEQEIEEKVMEEEFYNESRKPWEYKPEAVQASFKGESKTVKLARRSKINKIAEGYKAMAENFEAGKASDNEALELIAGLVGNGVAWNLTDAYIKTAMAMIDEGYIDGEGNILKLIEADISKKAPVKKARKYAKYIKKEAQAIDRDEVVMWVLNDEGLYNMALEAGVPEEEVGDEDSHLFNRFIDDNYDELYSAIKGAMGKDASLKKKAQEYITEKLYGTPEEAQAGLSDHKMNTGDTEEYEVIEDTTGGTGKFKIKKKDGTGGSQPSAPTMATVKSVKVNPETGEKQACLVEKDNEFKVVKWLGKTAQSEINNEIAVEIENNFPEVLATLSFYGAGKQESVDIQLKGDIDDDKAEEIVNMVIGFLWGKFGKKGELVRSQSISKSDVWENDVNHLVEYEIAFGESEELPKEDMGEDEE